MELVDAEPLRSMNINAEQQALFIQRLTVKYGRQFTHDATFIHSIETAFTLVENKINPSDCMHALKFAGLVNLEQLLQASPAAMAGAGVSASTVGFFAATAEQTTWADAAKPHIATRK